MWSWLRADAPLGRALRRPFIAAVVLLAVYGALSLVMDPGGFLGTDTGTKVATLEVMVRGDTADPDVGYWAEDLDPTGALHPMYQSTKTDDGRWVAVTTLPMLEAARPLYDLGGYRLTLLLPMLGSVAAALGAAALARRLGSADGMGAFWLIGLASPLTIYALDFWEHAIGVACCLWAVVLLVDVLERGSRWGGLVAGLLFGAAATMRTESMVYALVTVGVICGLQLQRRGSVVPALVTGMTAVVGFAVPVVANVALERSVGGISRSERATGTATTAGSRFADRIQEALQTLLGANAGEYALSVLVGFALVLVVVLAFRAEARRDLTFARVALALAACVYLFGALGGLGFVPGLTAAFPVALAAVIRRDRTSVGSTVTVIALASLPLVYAFQYVGGGAPQWGGRYTLVSAALLGVVGVVGLLERHPVVGRGLIGLCVLVTGLGVAWVSVRTRGVDEFFEDLKAQSEPVVITRQAFLLREGGTALLGERWFSVKDEETFTRAVDATRTLGEERFSVLEWGDEAPPDDALPEDVREVDRALLRFVDVPVGLVTYEFVR